MNNFIITNVNIKNFRGIKSLSMPFTNNEKLIILCGPNGYGKTSFIDAIEWCLTGTVRRIVEEAQARGDKSISIMKKSLILNKDANGQPVTVEIELANEKGKVAFTRTSNCGLYTGDDTRLTITKPDNIEGKTIDDIFGGDISIEQHFYDHFICSQDKNIKLFSKGRKDFYDLFRIYLGDDNNCEILLKKLSDVIEKLNNEIKINAIEIEKCNALISSDIDDLNVDNILEDYNENEKSHGHFGIIEKNDIITNSSYLSSSMGEETYKANLIIEMYNRYKKNKNLNSHIIYRKDKAKYEDFISNVYVKFSQNENAITSLKQININSVLSEIAELSNALQKVELIFKSAIPSINQIEMIIKENNLLIIRSDLLQSLTNYVNEYNTISNLLEANKGNDRMIEAINELIVNEEIWYQYVENTSECPLCKRKGLTIVDLKSAIDTYKENQSIHDKTIVDGQKRINQLENEIRRLSNKIYTDLKTHFSNKLADLNAIQSNYINTIDFIKKCNEFFIIDITSSTIESLKNQLYQQYTEHPGRMHTEFSTISLSVLEDMYKNESIEIDKFQKDRSTSLEKIDIKYYIKRMELLKCINKIINSSKSIEKKTDLLAQNSRATKSIGYLEGLKTKISQSDGEFEEQIVDSISTMINGVLSKINRHSKYDTLLIRRPNTKAQIIELLVDNDTNFSNVLSTGQVTSVALSIFISLALLNSENTFKCYFLDDPIQNLDDINILSLIDLLKMQIKNEHGFANQVFVTTCNTDFSDLLNYKMSSSGVPSKYLKLIDYGVYA